MKKLKVTKAASRPSVAERAAVAIKQAGAHARGEVVPGTVVRKPVDVKKVRAKVGMSQVEFSSTFGFSLGAVRDWEQGRATPEMSNTILMHGIIMNPDFVKEAARKAREAA